MNTTTLSRADAAIIRLAKSSLIPLKDTPEYYRQLARAHPDDVRVVIELIATVKELPEKERQAFGDEMCERADFLLKQSAARVSAWVPAKLTLAQFAHCAELTETTLLHHIRTDRKEISNYVTGRPAMVSWCAFRECYAIETEDAHRRLLELGPVPQGIVMMREAPASDMAPIWP